MLDLLVFLGPADRCSAGFVCSSGSWRESSAAERDRIALRSPPLLAHPFTALNALVLLNAASVFL